MCDNAPVVNIAAWLKYPEGSDPLALKVPNRTATAPASAAMTSATPDACRSSHRRAAIRSDEIARDRCAARNHNPKASAAAAAVRSGECADSRTPASDVANPPLAARPTEIVTREKANTRRARLGTKARKVTKNAKHENTKGVKTRKAFRVFASLRVLREPSCLRV